MRVFGGFAEKLAARDRGVRSAHATRKRAMRKRTMRTGTRARRGFTLMEMAVCLVVMAVAASVVAPAISRLGDGKPEAGGDKLVALLRQARNYAIERNYLVTVHLDPVTSRFRVDTTGRAGMGVLADSTLDLGDSETMESPLDRLQFTFRPTGAAQADTVIVRGIGTTSVLVVDAWTGEAKLVAR